MSQWLFVYDTLLNYDVQRALFKRDINVYSYTMQFVERCTGLDGFKYLVDNFESSVDGLLLELTDEEQNIVGLWLGSVYKKKCMYAVDLDQIVDYYTYEVIPEANKRKYISMQGSLGVMTPEDIVQLAEDFRKYIDDTAKVLAVETPIK